MILPISTPPQPKWKKREDNAGYIFFQISLFYEKPDEIPSFLSEEQFSMLKPFFYVQQIQTRLKHS